MFVAKFVGHFLVFPSEPSSFFQKADVSQMVLQHSSSYQREKMGKEE